MKKALSALNDKELQQLAAIGDRFAFEVIFDRYWKRLFTYAYKIYREEDICEDIVQEIFISLWNAIPNTVILNLESYLIRAVKYKVANHIRDLKYTKEHIDILNTIAVTPKTVTDLEYIDLEKGIFKEIDKLSPKCREVFILSRFENYSNNEIATMLNLSLHTVEKHISNALKHLRNNIDNYQLSAFVIAMFI